MVICRERVAYLRMAQLMPLPLTGSCFSKIWTVFTFLVPAHPGSPGERAVKWVCVMSCGYSAYVDACDEVIVLSTLKGSLISHCLPPRRCVLPIQISLPDQLVLLAAFPLGPF